ncbi:MAG: hypothetical protein LBS67_01725, partial [Clostridiales Family XIII bacterium]|nr:hypothetical protein [Clostridiales Family XIII bacterium]
MIALPDYVYPEKIKIYSEDEEARIFIRGLLPRGYGGKIQFVNVSIGGDQLISLARQAKVPEFLNSIVILDGDKNPSRKPKNFIILPSEGDSPEKVLFRYLRRFTENDD